ncbi:MAG TPA: adenylate/guanylate cyclase domain-containing protein [Acidimicrobiia bacterium]
MSERIDIAELESHGLYDPAAPDADEQRALLQYLVSEGVALDDMVEAHRIGRLPFVAGDIHIRPGVPVYTINEVATKTGVDAGLLMRVWRASGFAIAPPDKPMFSDADVQALAMFTLAVQRFGEEPTLQLARVFGASLARMAAAAFHTALAYAQDAFAPRAPSVLAAARASTEMGLMAEMSGTALDSLFRHHIAATAQWFDRVPSPDPETAPLAIGFADLVGFTSLSQRRDVHELARTVGEFDALTSEIASDGGGRVVKLIGDEVMFATADPRQAVAIALELADALADHPILPTMRAAVACGTVLVRDGDCFGPVVNLAARLVHLAEPGHVVVPVGTVVSDDAFLVEPTGTCDVRGFDEPVAVARVDRA